MQREYILIACLVGLGIWLLRKDKDDDDDDDGEEPTSGEESIAAIDRLIKRVKANPELIEEIAEDE